MLELFGQRPFLIGVVHLLPTPGAPRWGGDREALLERAVADAGALARGGCDGLLVENFGDVPFFPEGVPPETTATLALALAAVGRAGGGLPVGVNVLRNDARAAVGLCAATGAAFLRVNVHVGAAVTDQGLVSGRAARTLRARGRLAPKAKILADVQVKHAAPLAPQPLDQAARDTLERGLADALIVTGAATGQAPALDDLSLVRSAIGPGQTLILGSGVDLENARHLIEMAEGAIVGTAFERDGRVGEPVEEERVRAMRALLAR